MKKAEIIEILKEMKRVLEMPPEDYAAEWNSKHPEYKPIKLDDVWAFRTGVVISDIEWILER